MWSIFHVMVTSLGEVVALRTSNTIKIAAVFLEEEEICYKMVYYAF